MPNTCSECWKYTKQCANCLRRFIVTREGVRTLRRRWFDDGTSTPIVEVFTT